MGLERKKAVAGKLLIGLEIIQPKARHVRAFLCQSSLISLITQATNTARIHRPTIYVMRVDIAALLEVRDT